jgi:hypothetical protein
LRDMDVPAVGRTGELGVVARRRGKRLGAAARSEKGGGRRMDRRPLKPHHGLTLLPLTVIVREAELSSTTPLRPVLWKQRDQP